MIFSLVLSVAAILPSIESFCFWVIAVVADDRGHLEGSPFFITSYSYVVLIGSARDIHGTLSFSFSRGLAHIRTISHKHTATLNYY